MRRAALRSALSVKARDSSIVLIDELKIKEPKTKTMVKALNKLSGKGSALILIPEKSEAYESVMRSTQNIPDAKILVAGYLNIHDLMTFDKVIMPLAALEQVKTVLG